MDKITVIYHRADFDGIFCQEIARHFLTGQDVEFIGWDYADVKIPFPADGVVYLLDLSPECFEGEPDLLNIKWGRLIWIDHHKSAIERWPAEFPGYRIDGVAACRLAWQWFAACGQRDEVLGNQSKADFIERRVTEPYAVRLAGEYDIWDKRDPNADVFQLGLRSRELIAEDWRQFLALPSAGNDSAAIPLPVYELIIDGRLLQRYQNQKDAGIVNACGFVVEFHGLKFLALNTAGKGSMQFAAKDVPETGHDALMKFSWVNGQWDVSLYHAKHRSDIDLTQIAVGYGGGGHRGACGFRIRSLPFLS